MHNNYHKAEHKHVPVVMEKKKIQHDCQGAPEQLNLLKALFIQLPGPHHWGFSIWFAACGQVCVQDYISVLRI